MTAVCHVITALERGGAENHLVELARAQRAAGLDVSIASLKGDGWWGARLRAEGLRIDDLGWRGWRDPRPIARLVRLLRRHRPDIVHGHLLGAEPAAVIAHAIAAPRAALVITRHNDDPLGLERGLGPVTRLLTRRARRVIAISDAVAADLARRGIARDRIDVIRYGIDPQPWMQPDRAAATALRAAWGGRVVVGCIARLVPQKAHEVLLEAFARASAPDWRLVLVGSGPREAELRALAEHLGIAARTVWAGQRSDMPEIVHACDVLALSSVYEGLGLVLLEAMAAARPVVASRVSAIPEIVGPDAGLLVPPRDPDALAAALARAADPAVAAACGAAGRARVLRDFTVEAMRAATAAVYRAALAERACAA
jgi:glycosyltransferase involved in cell wall biosynthesis